MVTQELDFEKKRQRYDLSAFRQAMSSKFLIKESYDVSDIFKFLYNKVQAEIIQHQHLTFDKIALEGGSEEAKKDNKNKKTKTKKGGPMDIIREDEEEWGDKSAFKVTTNLTRPNKNTDPDV